MEEEQRVFELPHPLLIPLVVQLIFTTLGNNALLSARRVCPGWYKLATEEYLGRSTGKLVDADWRSVRPFMTVMAPSSPANLPIVRFLLRINLNSFSVVALYQFLTFIAPVVKVLNFLLLENYYPRQPLDESSVAHLLSELNQWDDRVLSMPSLEEMDVTLGAGQFEDIPTSFVQVVEQLTIKVLRGARNLKGFDSSFFIEGGRQVVDVAAIYSALPASLPKLRYLDRISPPYETLLPLNIHLEELSEERSPTNCLVPFLHSQTKSLQRLKCDRLEDLYRMGNFPTLSAVTKLVAKAEWNSSFEFISAFPNLVQLLVEIQGGPDDSDLGKPLQHLPNHPSVRKLFVNTAEELEMINFRRLSQTFVNVAHLSFADGGSWRCLPQLFTYFPNIQWLYLPFSYGNPDLRELESSLTGFPRLVCQELKERGLDDPRVAVDIAKEPSVVGMTNLKRLKILEIQATPEQYDVIFSHLTLHSVFMKMETLTEVRLVKEKDIPEVCRPFLENLRGVKFFRTKSCAYGNSPHLF